MDAGEKIDQDEISPFAHRLVWLHKMIRSGYPFKGDDLELEVWEMLGAVQLMTEHIKEKRSMMILAPRAMGMM